MWRMVKGFKMYINTVRETDYLVQREGLRYSSRYCTIIKTSTCLIDENGGILEGRGYVYHILTMGMAAETVFEKGNLTKAR